LTLAMQSMPEEDRDRVAGAGWHLADARAATRDCASFREFIQRSAGELTVVKQIYAGVPSGWFSDRSACCLASGRPVVMQRTGFERWLPTGQGLFAFDDIDGAAAALAAIDADPAGHSSGARAIAEKHFDGHRVLADLLKQVM
jgi:hypothetical protein